jgi:hypothetical protein
MADRMCVISVILPSLPRTERLFTFKPARRCQVELLGVQVCS